MSSDEYTKLDVYIFITKLLKLPSLCLICIFRLTQIFYGPVNFEIVRFDYIHEKNQFYVKNMKILIHMHYICLLTVDVC